MAKAADSGGGEEDTLIVAKSLIRVARARSVPVNAIVVAIVVAAQVGCRKTVTRHNSVDRGVRTAVPLTVLEYGKDKQSCAAGLKCGAWSCCDSIRLTGGTFPMGRSEKDRDSLPPTPGDVDYREDESSDVPEHAVTLSSFALDRFEVTVGRFRAFVAAYDGSAPKNGFGGPLGWNSSWNSRLPDRAALANGPTCTQIVNPSWGPTWTEKIGHNETKPINCVNWWLALAFCLWDGGRLPTEAEWEYAAAGGEENRPFVWGDRVPPPCKIALDCPELVVYGDDNPLKFRPVGSAPLGVGRWGHFDLAGSVGEWVFDAFDPRAYRHCSDRDPYVAVSAKDPDNVYKGDLRVNRGGGYSVSSGLRVTERHYAPPWVATDEYGFRCARESSR